jgi:ribosomal protein S17
MELAGKVKKADFQKIIGVSFEDFSNYIKYNYYTTIKTKRFSISNDIKEKCQENEFIMSVIDYIASYDIGEIAVGDLCRLSTYGIVKRNGEDCIVMIDYGIDEDISNKYYKKMMNIFVIGDIHAEYQKLEEVIKKSNIDKENDMLITLGDVVDRGAD